MTAAPPGDPGGGARVEMHGESRDSSTFTQIGTQIIQPVTLGAHAEWYVQVMALGTFRNGPLDGDPSYRALAQAAGVSPTTVENWLVGTQFPQDEGKFLAVVRAVAVLAAALGVVAPAAGVVLGEDFWRQAYRAEARRRAAVVSDRVRQIVDPAPLARIHSVRASVCGGGTQALVSLP